MFSNIENSQLICRINQLTGATQEEHRQAVGEILKIQEKHFSVKYLISFNIFYKFFSVEECVLCRLSE